MPLDLARLLDPAHAAILINRPFEVHTETIEITSLMKILLAEKVAELRRKAG